MQSHYLSLTFSKSNTTPDQIETLMFILPENGFSGVEELDDNVVFYTKAEEFNEQSMLEVLHDYDFLKDVSYSIDQIAPVNWNLEWETHYYKPVVIAGKCAVRSSFHPKVEGVELEIIINPKMSFGTGHHATTSLAMQLIYTLDPKNKTILDMGCGTGILGILCSKLGAKSVVGIDNDSICIENTTENCEINNIYNFSVFEGDSASLDSKVDAVDIFIANINKNVLLNDIKSYSLKMNPNAMLILSGFFVTDAKDIIEEATKHNLKLETKMEMDNWCALLLNNN